MLNFEVRYADNWQNKAKMARETTNYRCCLCMKKSNHLEVHHAVYSNKKNKRIAGYELIGIHIFPLCPKCHKIAHSTQNWIKDNNNPVLRNRNTAKFYRTIVNNFNRIKMR